MFLGAGKAPTLGGGFHVSLGKESRAQTLQNGIFLRGLQGWVGSQAGQGAGRRASVAACSDQRASREELFEAAPPQPSGLCRAPWACCSHCGAALRALGTQWARAFRSQSVSVSTEMTWGQQFDLQCDHFRCVL